MSTNDKPDIMRVRGKTMYAKVFQPTQPAPDNEYGFTPEWTEDILVDRATRVELEGKGITIKDQNDKYKLFCEQEGLNADGYDGSFIKVKKSTIRKVYDKDKGEVAKDAKGNALTEAAPRPRVVDSLGNEIPEEAGLLIGNGSDVEVTFTVTKPRLPNGAIRSSGYGCRLIETKILNLKEYKAKEKGTFVFANADAPQHGDALEEDDMPF